ncbi:MAG: autotransporter-associated beta strand repeat-containing protein, partial [Planctomycetaceae bacterium]|nr:autotransporter-associated beta strand repeat-containing protein [Planctomycetaceae bacterium]
MFWNDDGSAPNIAWSNAANDIARFGGTGGTITLGGAITAGGLTFNTTGYSIVPTTTEILTLAGLNPTITVTNLGDTASIAAQIAGTNGLIKAGAGTLVLSGANSFTGVAQLDAGILRAQSIASALGAGTLTLAGGELQLANNTGLNFGRNTTVTGNATITSDVVSIGAGVTHTLGTLSIGANTLQIVRGSNATSGTGGISVGAVTLTGSPTFNVQTNALLTTGAISGAGFGLTKTGDGQLTNNNASSYSGATTLSGGIYSTNSLAAGGANSGIGSSSAAATNLVLDGGTLQYTGAVVSTDRLFTLTEFGGALDASGASNAALTLSNTGAMGLSGTGARILTLTGASTGNNALLAAIGDVTGGATTINKTGAGRWILGGANTFTGTVGVSAGNLVATATALNTSFANAVVLNGGTLDLRDDGSGYGNLQNIVFGDDVTVSANSTVSVDRTGTTGFPGSTALNKKFQFNTLSIGNNRLTVNNLNGYGLEFTGATTLGAATPTFVVLNPTTAATSNLVAGLTLSGQVS